MHYTPRLQSNPFAATAPPFPADSTETQHECTEHLAKNLDKLCHQAPEFLACMLSRKISKALIPHEKIDPCKQSACIQIWMCARLCDKLAGIQGLVGMKWHGHDRNAVVRSLHHSTAFCPFINLSYIHHFSAKRKGVSCRQAAVIGCHNHTL